MDEHKYEVIDTSGPDYGHKDKHSKKGKKKKLGRGVKALIAILLVFVIVIGAGTTVVHLYLNKMNFGDSVGEVDPQLDADEELIFDTQIEADADIRANLDDNQIWYDDRVYNILLVGVDYGDAEKVMFEGAYLPRSDSMILLSINSVTNTINMVSLSRAVYVAIPGHGNKRLNTAHAYGGASLLVDTIEQNYKIRIDKYVTVDISGFTDIIDILGGVKIELTAEEARYVVGKRQAGTYTLNGEQATAYSRLRSIDSDRKRTGRQRAVLNAIFNKFKSSSVSTMLGMLDEVLPLVTTNFTKTELIAQASNATKYLSMSVKQDIIPHEATTLTMRDGKEVLILNWDTTKKYVHDLLYPDMVPQSLQ